MKIVHSRDKYDKDNKKVGIRLTFRRNRGSRVPGSKLTEEKVTDIRRALAEGASLRKLARQYHVTHVTIHHIKSRTTWKHVA